MPEHDAMHTGSQPDLEPGVSKFTTREEDLTPTETKIDAPMDSQMFIEVPHATHLGGATLEDPSEIRENLLRRRLMPMEHIEVMPPISGSGVKQVRAVQ